MPKAAAAPPYREARDTTSIRGLPGVIRTVLHAHEGHRNNALFWASCRFFEMACAGLITVSLASELLLEAATQTGLTRREAVATIQSAFEGRRRHG
jgi:hypothetical protein